MTDKLSNSDSKSSAEQLASFGGGKLFERPRSTSNLLRPDFDKYMAYSKTFFDSQRYTNNGPNVRLLEERLAKLHEVNYCVTFCSGFWGLVATISAVALKGKSELIMPSLTYRRMAEIASWSKLTPHFCDVSEQTLAMTAKTVEPCINDNTAAILAAHPIVNCCDVEGLTELARKRNIPLIFDSVESLYETVPGGKVGGFGTAEGFSLHACKLLNGGGGGYITTNDKALAKKLKSVRSFGYDGLDNIVVDQGFNAKLNEMHAAMTLASLDDIETQVASNKANYQLYQEQLEDVKGIRLIEFDSHYQSGYKNIVVELLDEWPLSREVTIKLLNEENILARTYYSPPLHHKTREFEHISAQLTVTDSLAKRFVNLPCGQRVNGQDIKQIIGFLKFIFNYSESIKQKIKQHESS